MLTEKQQQLSEDLNWLDEVENREIRNVLSISGGKDSTALWLLAIERGVEHTPVFADTGNEHPQTLEYLDYLENELGPLVRVKADFAAALRRRQANIKAKWPALGKSDAQIDQALKATEPTGIPFLDLSLAKGSFPWPQARFCTSELKVVPMRDQIYDPMLADGLTVVSWQGVRADESLSRAKLCVADAPEDGLIRYRPMIAWDVNDVFEMHRRHSIDPNPLYKQGLARVGCMPCIMVSQKELNEIAKRFPEEIERIRQWEQIVASCSTDEQAAMLPSRRKGKGHAGLSVKDHRGIDVQVLWASKAENPTLDLFQDESAGCSSQYGLCE